MAGKIVLTPEILKSQGEEMNRLMAEYEGLFSSVTSTLNSTNANWSQNLSNNFAGKIISAQSSFSGIVSMLGAGASAAIKSAVTMESVDGQLSKYMNGDGTKASTSNINLTGDLKKDIVKNAKEHYDSQIDSNRKSTDKGYETTSFSEEEEYHWGDINATVKTNAQTTYWSTSEGKKHAIGKVGHTTTAKDIYISEGCSKDEGINIKINTLDMHATENFDPAKGNAYASGGAEWDAFSVGVKVGNADTGVGTVAAHVKTGLGASGTLGISDGRFRAKGSLALGLGMDYDIDINYKNAWNGLKGGVSYGVKNFFW